MRAPVHVLHSPEAPVAAGAVAFPGVLVSYFGGPIISNIHVVQVLYGAGSYLPGVQSTTTPSVASFFADITQSPFFDFLAEYSTVGVTAIDGTAGANQALGHGFFDGQVTIAPSAANNGASISDDQIQAELLAQVNAGHLPAPVMDAQGNVNTLYMIYFPAGKTILQGNTSSCQNGGFCAYHNSTNALFSGKNLLYGVMPDTQPPSLCARGCGSGSPLDIVTNVTSHELAEAVTDANVGPVNTFAAPLAWLDPINGEIGDICVGREASVTANGTLYIVQQIFSNVQGDCVAGPLQFRMVAVPDVGAGTQFDISMVVVSNAGTSVLTGYAGTVHFTSSDPAAVLPVDYTFTVGDSGLHHFVATLNTSGLQTITAADTVLKGTDSPVTVGVNQPNVSQFSLASPQFAAIGASVTVVVQALDPSSVPQASFNGKVHFTSSDTGAILPPDTSLVNGVGTFSVTFNNAAIQNLQVADALTRTIVKSVPVTVTAAGANPTTTTLSVNINPSIFGQQLLLTTAITGNGVATSGGILTLTVDGFPFVEGGIFDTSVQSLSAPGGTHTVYANYQGDGVRGNSASAPLTIVVNPAASTTVLTTSASSASFGAPVTLTTQTIPAASNRGSVAFFDGANPFAIVPASQAAFPFGFTIGSLPPGSHSITAAFSGSPDLLASTSAPITQVITPGLTPNYSLSSTTNVGTVAVGQKAIFTITAQAINGFTGDVRFSCGALPALTTCTFTPELAAVGNGVFSATTMLSVKTTGPHASLQPTGLPIPGAGRRVNVLAWGGGLFVFAAVLLVGAGQGKHRRTLGLTLAALVLALAVISCGGHGTQQSGPSPTPTPPPATPAGTSSITVSAAGIATSGSKPANPNQQLHISITVLQ
ncbi:MAG TPA: Ig-like domain-containing protein [Candidatus Saccharimonadales bacterium]|nr:Ig-like domain-containing protein [Candidatus Saccharimonadales bacterium]